MLTDFQLKPVASCDTRFFFLLLHLWHPHFICQLYLNLWGYSHKCEFSVWFIYNRRLWCHLAKMGKYLFSFYWPESRDFNVERRFCLEVKCDLFYVSFLSSRQKVELISFVLALQAVNINNWFSNEIFQMFSKNTFLFPSL